MAGLQIKMADVFEYKPDRPILDYQKRYAAYQPPRRNNRNDTLNY